MIVSQLGVKKDRVCKMITKDTVMQSVYRKMKPSSLNDGQKERRMHLSHYIIRHLQSEPDLPHRVSSNDERSGFFANDSETKSSSSESKPKKTRHLISKVKVILTTFFKVMGIIH